MVAGATAGLLERRAAGPIEGAEGADFVINPVRPTPEGELPMRRIFEDVQDNELEQLDL
jgi:adenylate cyclase